MQLPRRLQHQRPVRYMGERVLAMSVVQLLQALICQSGVWAKPGGGVTGRKNCFWLVGSPYQTRICPVPTVLIGYNYIGYGSGYSDHHAYCCELE